MKRFFITGATGNVGKEVIRFLTKLDPESEIIVGLRNVEKAKSHFSEYTTLKYRPFDFEDITTFKDAFANIELLFLLRPPHISEVKKYFAPLLRSAKESGIKKVVFISVQGAEKSSVIPHNKIEKLIKSFTFEYIFVRPSYFMQNLTTTLLPEIQKNRIITLPSANAKFLWVDVENLGEACAQVLYNFEKYAGKAYEITGSEMKSFFEVVDLINEVADTNITFKSINPFSFYFKKKREGLSHGFAVVMTVLHFIPQLEKEPAISNNFKMLTGKEPTLLREFIQREKEKFLVF